MAMRVRAAQRAALVSLASLAWGVVFAADTVIKDARIEFGDGRVMEKGSVWIHDGKIQDVQPALSIPGGLEVIDGAGLTVYPGFIDAYSTRGLKLPDAPEGATPPSVATTAPPTMWAGNRKGIRTVRAADCLNLGSTAEDARKNGVTCAFLCPGSGIIRGAGALTLMTDEKQSATPFGWELSFRGTGGGRPPGGGPPGQQTTQAGSGYPGSMMGYIALLRQTLFDAQAYAATSHEKEDADLKAISEVFKTTAVIAADTVADLTRADRLAQEFNFNAFICGGRDAYLMPSQIGSKYPVLASISIGNEPKVDSTSELPVGVQEFRKVTWKERASNIQQLIGGGAKVAFSSEGDGVGSYLADVRKLISLGLKREDALKSMTVVPAALFKMSDWGDVKAGSQANLTVMDGDFANEKSKVKMVFVNGKKFEVSK